MGTKYEKKGQFDFPLNNRCVLGIAQWEHQGGDPLHGSGRFTGRTISKVGAINNTLAACDAAYHETRSPGDLTWG